MKNTIKRILNYIKHFLSSVCAIIAIFIRNLFSSNTKHMLEDNRFQREIIVMGNGPSLNDLSLDRIDRSRYSLCCVNDFPARYARFMELKPEYLCLLDPAYFDFSVDAFADNFKELMSVIEQVNWNLTVICPQGKRLPVHNDNIGYRWINSGGISKNAFPKVRFWAYDRNYANTGGQNVVLGALYYFLASNHKKIYVAGVDFSDFKNLYVDEDNRIYVDSTHSYGSDRYYFDEMPEYGVKSFQQILRAYQKMFEQSEEVRQYADYKGIEVVNLSVLSYIDAFPKEKPIAVYGKLRDDD